MNRTFFDSIEMVMVDYCDADTQFRVTKLLNFRDITIIKAPRLFAFSILLIFNRKNTVKLTIFD